MRKAQKPLISITEIGEKYKDLFNYSKFNKIQSSCFDIAFRTNCNFVLCAPTGCGKTTVAEMSTCRALYQHEEPTLMLYISPLRSICQEKVRDWQKRFQPLKVRVEEYTGDSNIPFPTRLTCHTLLCTTPEKLDLATRLWKHRMKMFSNISLVIVDEIHMLSDSRGSVLEALLSRILYI